jgi:hypothetical protein
LIVELADSATSSANNIIYENRACDPFTIKSSKILKNRGPIVVTCGKGPGNGKKTG